MEDNVDIQTDHKRELVQGLTRLLIVSASSYVVAHLVGRAYDSALEKRSNPALADAE